MARIFRSAAALAMLAFAGLATAESPMRRMNALTNGGNNFMSNIVNSLASATAGDMLPAFKPDKELVMMQDTWRNGLNVMSVFEDNFKSEGMKLILDNANVQHEIMEKLPLLAAFDGFKAITGRRLDDAGTKAGFAEGVKSIMNALPNMLKTMKDPTISTRALSELLADDAEGMTEVFAAASSGDTGAMKKVEQALNEKIYPNINTDVLTELTATKPLKALIENKEIMRLIENDPIVNMALRADSPEQLDEFVKSYSAGRRFRF